MTAERHCASPWPNIRMTAILELRPNSASPSAVMGYNGCRDEVSGDFAPEVDITTHTLIGSRRRCCDRDPDAPVICGSAAYSAYPKRRARRAGACGRIQKPRRSCGSLARRSILEEALKLGAGYGEAYSTRSFIRTFYDWNRKEAERAWWRALQLNPGSAMIHHHYAHFLGVAGRFEEALAEMDQVGVLDPLLPIVHASFR